MSSKLSSNQVAYLKVTKDRTGYERENIFLYPDGLGIIVDDDEVIGETDPELLDCLLQHTDFELVLIGVFDEDADTSQIPLHPLGALNEDFLMDLVKLRSLIGELPDSAEESKLSDAEWGANPRSSTSGNPEIVDCRPTRAVSAHVGRVTNYRRQSSVGEKARQEMISWGAFMVSDGYAFLPKSRRLRARKGRRKRSHAGGGNEVQSARGK